jgi:hypothetical protein
MAQGGRLDALYGLTDVSLLVLCTAVGSVPDIAPSVSRQHARTALYVSHALYAGHALMVSLTKCSLCLSVSLPLCLSVSLPNCTLCPTALYVGDAVHVSTKSLVL